ncbi:MAG: hypothetical protein DRP85_03360 [Candidatus Makaraimicrobium thalassicum]|nr:MAG: hypothetical protein DRP85_03360 [Candidatus Omnitrophota bacterium]
MLDHEREIYNVELLLAGRASKAYELFFKDFLEKKRATLFEAFQSLGNTDSGGLMEVKRMLHTLNSLEEEINTIINSGKLAQKSLEEE